MAAPVGAFLVAHPIPTIESTWESRTLQSKGTTHGHTSASHDVTMTGLEVEALYDALGHDWIAITDYAVYTPDPGGPLVHVGGEELATGVSWPDHPHIVGLGLTETITAVDDGQDNIDALVAAGKIAVLAHPINDAYHLAMTGWTHVELNWLTGYNLAITSAVWDAALTAGQQVFALLSDDIHGPYTDGETALTADSRGSSVVNVDEVTEASVLAALRAGNYYLTSSTFNGAGVTAGITSITVDDGTITIAVPQESNIYWYGSGGGSLGSALGVTSDSYRPRGNEIYVRIKVVPTADTTRFALTQPIWVTA